MANDCISVCADSESCGGRLCIARDESYASSEGYSGAEAFSRHEAFTRDEAFAESDHVADVVSAIHDSCNYEGAPRRALNF